MKMLVIALGCIVLIGGCQPAPQRNRSEIKSVASTTPEMTTLITDMKTPLPSTTHNGNEKNKDQNASSQHFGNEENVVVLDQQINGQFAQISLLAEVIDISRQLPTIGVMPGFSNTDLLLDLCFEGIGKNSIEVSEGEMVTQTGSYRSMLAKYGTMMLSYSELGGSWYYTDNPENQFDPGNPLDEDESTQVLTEFNEAERQAKRFIDRIMLEEGSLFALEKVEEYGPTDRMVTGYYVFNYAPVIDTTLIESAAYRFSGSRIGSVDGLYIRITVSDGKICEIVGRTLLPYDVSGEAMPIVPSSKIPELLERQSHLLVAPEPLTVSEVMLKYIYCMKKNEPGVYELVPHWCIYADPLTGDNGAINMTFYLNAYNGELLF